MDKTNIGYPVLTKNMVDFFEQYALRNPVKELLLFRWKCEIFALAIKTMCAFVRKKQLNACAWIKIIFRGGYH